MLIQIHMLQNYAPSNLNRDDTGSPKNANFGGVLRGRISSQCLKRSIRMSEVFEEAFEEQGLLAKRTKRLPGLIRDELEAVGVDSETIEAIINRVPEIGSESGRERGRRTEEDEGPLETRQLIFIGQNELRPTAEKLLQIYQEQGEKKWAEMKIADITKELGASLPRSVDVAMFGRMTTSDAFEDVQAAVQVAHALSVNALEQEFDYFTAVDDISGESGAGMIGDVEYNSSTYYKYFNVHWEQLCKNLGGDVQVARRAVLALLEAAATAQPSGKQNTFAAHNLPDLILVEVREKNLPVSYANAFLKPASNSHKKTLMDDAVARLDDFVARIGTTYGLEAMDQRALTAVQDYTLSGAEVVPSLADLQEWLAVHLPEG
ncbi:MAG TPA: type I-E CRISPR-associated protein Cas7/Cse4/CasC [Anaerolineae bacterium]|nr:type I-E CRISPR-associated protein Cas7/Cse4/CasC [Anaerolineae bacterium]